MYLDSWWQTDVLVGKLSEFMAVKCVQSLLSSQPTRKQASRLHPVAGYPIQWLRIIQNSSISHWVSKSWAFTGHFTFKLPQTFPTKLCEAPWLRSEVSIWGRHSHGAGICCMLFSIWLYEQCLPTNWTYYLLRKTIASKEFLADP